MANVTIPSSPEDRRKVQEALREFSNSLTRAEAEKDFQKDVLDRMQDDFALPKATMRKVAVIYHKQNLSEVVGQVSDIEDLYEALVK
jgi:hypothetical protein